jgi:hypothetical protein
LFETIRSEETNQIAVVTGSKPNKRSNINNIRLEATRHFRNKKREYLKDKINELAVNGKNKNTRELYRKVTEFKKDYHPRSNLVKDDTGDLLAYSHKILNRWKNYYS